MRAPIVFIADYPFGDKIKDGMYQRIMAIDKEFEGFERIYLSISFKSNFRQKIVKKDNLTVIYLNYFLHQKQIRDIIKQGSAVYMHSVYNSFRVLLHAGLMSKKCSVLDAHGVVPEECSFQGMWLRSMLYDTVEKRIFKKLSYVITVSEEMISHFKDKYSDKNSIEYILKPIYSTNVIEKKASLPEELNSKDINIVYSGNLQAWQNIELMVQTIKKMDNPRYHFIILTQYPAKMQQMFGNLMQSRHITVRSVYPEELSNYYEFCEYGFILRDETLLNIVSAPTKMIEYLIFGLTPLVLSPKIGDWYNNGYEYISIASESLNSLPKRKSIRNKDLALKSIQQNEKTSIPGLIFGITAKSQS